MSKWIMGGKCSECGQEFQGMHLASKTTCSATCRKARERRIAKSPDIYLICLSALGDMRKGIKRRENLEVFISQLERLKGEINDLLLLAGHKESVDRLAMLNDLAKKRNNV